LNQTGELKATSADEQVGEVIVEGGGILIGGEVAALAAPRGDGVGDAADEARTPLSRSGVFIWP